MADRVDRLDSGVNFSWISALREEQFPPVPIKEVDDFIETILSDPDSPKVNWPKSIEWSEEEVEPVPELEISLPSREFGTRGLWAELRLNYGGVRISGHDTRASLLDKPNRRICLRSFEREKELLEKIRSVVGLEPISEEHMFQVAEESFSNAVSEILSWGWRVEAKGKLIRQVADFQIEVVSGVDWFDLKGTATYSTGLKIGIPELIAACQGKDPLIPLGDGTYGMLPSEWLKRYGSLKEVGKNKSDGIRFQKSQGALLAAWLAEEKNLRSDKAFQNLMQGLHAFGKLKARDPGKFFHGKLCPYQKEGLAWLEELKKLDLGGILADDMGLGKTVQILAHLDLEYQRLKKSERLPSLAVLPKSLMFNWKEEAERFAPRLKVLSYEGQGRASLLGEIPNADLVLVTYATLRLDIEKLRDLGFHYVIADEAQAIKNAKSVSHISCSVIRGKHRLALTGTPVENSIEDLFSLLDFVSPGLLGPSLKNRLAEAGKAGSLDTDMISQLAKALRPFILRRTKSQVLKDLPEKSEKVIHCEFSPGELKKYDELREYYRIHLKTEIQNRGLAKSKIVVLEALLRLRQAACHPALIDKRQFKADSAKLDTLLTQVEEAISESHKVLIFSQFTSFLDLVGTALTRRKISFVRLDGQTGAEDRKASVSRFQTDPSLSAFLISLKAGGVGLNLTAADYVFILDPWWNPAAEAQAIDRTHRIGQKNKVMAYRLITKGTVEEKILELQKSKREIADAIISSDSSLLRKLSLDDIELLLS
jgi:superfamily II DNA or RNA helicase